MEFEGPPTEIPSKSCLPHLPQEPRRGQVIPTQTLGRPQEEAVCEVLAAEEGLTPHTTGPGHAGGRDGQP